MKSWRDVRPQVLGVASRGDELLVEFYEGPDEEFYRPLGGGIEFGESSAEAIVREFDEELGEAVEAGDVLGTVENLFRWDGESFHEMAVVRQVTFRDERVYEYERLTVEETDGSQRLATWEPLDSFGEQKRLLPAGIERILRGEQTHIISPAIDTESRSA